MLKDDILFYTPSICACFLAVREFATFHTRAANFPVYTENFIIMCARAANSTRLVEFLSCCLMTYKVNARFYFDITLQKQNKVTLI